jgi:ABC-type dipeptide/oligopeptide/nickel transport system permease component
MKFSLARTLAQRLLYALPVVLVVVTAVFFLIHMVPGDPVEQMLGERAQPGDIEALRHSLGLDRPVGEQYLDYLKGAIRGDWGTSFRFNDPVWTLIRSRYPATIELTLAALVVALLLSIPAGIHSAVHRGRWDDHVLGFVSLLGLSFPNFALGPVSILIFAIALDWLPVSGYGGLAHLVLPALTLGAALAAILTRMVRAAMLEELGQDYIRTARAKGLAERNVLYRHALRNGLISVVTVVGLQFGALLAGAMVTETIFSWPGLGRLTLQAINSRDYPLVQGCFLAISVTYIFVNLLTDLVYTLVDPRIREV